MQRIKGTASRVDISDSFAEGRVVFGACARLQRPDEHGKWKCAGQAWCGCAECKAVRSPFSLACPDRCEVTP